MSTYVDLDAAELYQRAGRVPPAVLIAYLTEAGWSTGRSGSETTRVWKSPNPEGIGQSLYMPLHPEFDDYGTMMAALLERLATLQRRPVTHILESLLSAVEFLTHRFRLLTSSDSGSLPFDQSWRLHKAAYEVILAGAVSTALGDEPPVVQPSYKPPLAKRFLQSSLLAPSESGSYVLVVRTPLDINGTPTGRDPGRQDPLFAFEEEVEEEQADERPFGAAVAQDLSTALAAVKEMLRMTLPRAGGRLPEGAMRELQAQGVSSNLCQALAELSGNGQSDRFDFELAIAEQPDPSAPRTVHPVGFTAAESLRLKTFSDIMKRQYRNDPVVLYGTVQNLDRANPNGRGPGVVTIAGYLEGESSRSAHRFRVHLDEKSYSRATRAHDEGRRVRVSGTLAPTGTRQHIHDASLVIAASHAHPQSAPGAS